MRCRDPGVLGRKVLVVAAAALLAAPAGAVEPGLETPRRALQLFVDSARGADYRLAARALDLTALPDARRLEEGPRLARQLKFVLDQVLWLEWDRLSDSPDGDPGDGPEADEVGAIGIGGGRVPVRVVRSGDGSWRLGRGVVAAIPRLYAAYGPGWIGERVPEVLDDASFLSVRAWQWLGLALALVAAAAGGLALGAVARRAALRLARRTRATWDDRLVAAASGPATSLLGVATFVATVRLLHLAAPAQEALDLAVRIAAVVLFSWAGLRAVSFSSEVLDQRVVRAGGGLAARSRLTQIMVLKRVAGVVILVVGGSLVLMQFAALRTMGTSLLASAGVAGIVVGLAAQRSIATLLAGLQISLTQPVRVGDVVVIEGEWGTIEEITLSYVVVKVWDLRRLVVPITRILEAPFQNWTRSGSQILGTVFLCADYRLPVGEVRRELQRFVKLRHEWDGEVVGLQVTDATEHTIQLRALVSSPDASSSWDLRCAVREHLVAFLQQLDGGAYLPRTRLETPRPPRNVVATDVAAPLAPGPGQAKT